MQPDPSKFSNQLNLYELLARLRVRQARITYALLYQLYVLRTNTYPPSTT
jgi:hypothetical protein